MTVINHFVVAEDDLEEQMEDEEIYDMGSYNHGYVQINLGALLKMAGEFTVCGELTLDVGSLDLSKFQIKAREGIKPDLCVYSKRGLSRPVDILKMTEMPLLAVEIISPMQGSYEILQKFQVYFALGIKSCWLVDPATEVVVVYANMNSHKTFSGNEVVDEILNIRIPISKIFE